MFVCLLFPGKVMPSNHWLTMQHILAWHLARVNKHLQVFSIKVKITIKKNVIVEKKANKIFQSVKINYKKKQEKKTD